VDQNPIRIILLDDHHIVLDGLKSLFEGDPAFQILAAVNSGELALDYMKQEEPDVVLIDFGLPGISGLDLVKKVKLSYPNVKIAILSMHDEDSLVKAVLKEGVNGYMLKSISQFELKNGLKLIAMGYPYVSPEITRIVLSDLSNPKQKNELLTEREMEILRLITREYSNKQIAEKLFISERTVETHRKNIFRKTNTSSIVGLVRFAFSQNIV
jgi:two-component system, NarL family, nitrate/nitrite response regulator NarL